MIYYRTLKKKQTPYVVDFRLIWQANSIASSYMFIFMSDSHLNLL